jgi:hypothetical protein
MLNIPNKNDRKGTLIDLVIADESQEIGLSKDETEELPSGMYKACFYDKKGLVLSIDQTGKSTIYRLATQEQVNLAFIEAIMNAFTP